MEGSRKRELEKRGKKWSGIGKKSEGAIKERTIAIRRYTRDT